MELFDNKSAKVLNRFLEPYLKNNGSAKYKKGSKEYNAPDGIKK